MLLYSSLFLAEIFLIYFLSRKNIKMIYDIIPFKRAAHLFVYILFLPGIVVHELAHFFVASLLLLKVREVSILPEFRSRSIKLGKVVYERRDFLRGFLVGVAPFFFGLFILFLISYLELFPSDSLFQNLFFGYLIFTISAFMFSSKQDLKDFSYLVPFLVFAFVLAKLFEVDIVKVLSVFSTTETDFLFLKGIVYYFSFSFFVQSFIFLLLFLIKKIVKFQI